MQVAGRRHVERVEQPDGEAAAKMVVVDEESEMDAEGDE
jgi:hypothetical protein